MVNSYSFGFEHDSFNINNFDYNESNLLLNTTNDYGEYEFKLTLKSQNTNVYWHKNFNKYFNKKNNTLNFDLNTKYLNSGEYELELKVYYNDLIVYENNSLFNLNVDSDFNFKSVNFYSLNSLQDFGYYKELVFELDVYSSDNINLDFQYELGNEYGESIKNYSDNINLNNGENLIYININGTDIYKSEKDGRYLLRNIEIYKNGKLMVGYYNSTLSDDASYIEFYNWDLPPLEDNTKINQQSNLNELQQNNRNSRSSSSSSSSISYQNDIENNSKKHENNVENKENSEIVETNDIEKNNVEEVISSNSSNINNSDSRKIDFEEISESTRLDIKTLGSALIGIIMVIGIMTMIPK